MELCPAHMLICLLGLFMYMQYINGSGLVWPYMCGLICVALYVWPYMCVCLVLPYMYMHVCLPCMHMQYVNGSGLVWLSVHQRCS